jgi:hypothetical protein
MQYLSPEVVAIYGRPCRGSDRWLAELTDAFACSRI